MLVKHHGRLTAPFVLAAAFTTVVASACSDEFSNCRETHTCPRPAGSDGGAGGIAAGGAPASGGAPEDEVGGAASGEAGAGSTGPETALGEPCDANGALSCNGAAQKLTLLCKNGIWTENEVCEGNENCDQTNGTCAPIAEECADKRGGELYCADGETLHRCGPDLVSTELVEECEGTCIAASGSAACVPPGCGDGLVQDEEACDDENTESGDGCSATCRVEPVQLVAAGGSFKRGVVPTWNICALGSNGKIRCFAPGKTDWLWADVLLEPSEKAIAIAGDGYTSSSSLCALLSTGDVRCWGLNTRGTLGLGDNDARTFADASANVNLGANEKATSVAVGRDHICAVVNEGRVKCWGSNAWGQLGFTPDPNNAAVGDAPDEMGDQLAPVPSSTTRKASVVVAGGDYSCAIRQDQSLRCWGSGPLGAYTPQGDMNLGSVLSVSEAAVGPDHGCALLTSDDLKCWGNNSVGQLGQDDQNDRNSAATMGNNLGAVHLGAGRTAKHVAAGISLSCAILDDGSVKCWGSNGYGQLGMGTTTPFGDKPGHMAALKAIDLGQGRRAKQLALGAYTYCALLEDGQVTCWGSVNLPASDVLGNEPNEMGDKLPIVPIQF